MLKTVELTDPHHWNETVLGLPHPHILQSYQWGQFKGRYGWRPRYLVFQDAGTVRAAALVLKRTLPRLPVNVLYIPKGPLLDYRDIPLLGEVLSHLQDLARRERAIFIKVDPDVAADDEAVERCLTAHGWRLSTEQIQFRSTVLLDLSASEDDLLAAMKSKTRYNIRLARRKRVEVVLGGLDDLPLLYSMYAETSRRNGFVIRPYDYYENAWGSFVREGLARIFLARYDGETLAGVVIFRFGDTAWYMYGASVNRHRNLMPNHLLQWEAICWARSQGCTTYDMWGAPDVPKESDPMWGVYRFKAGFGGTFVQHIGAYDYPTSPGLYWLYTTLIPRYLAILRARHQTSPTLLRLSGKSGQISRD